MAVGESDRQQAAVHLRAGLAPPLQEIFDLLWSKKALGSSVRLRTTAAFLTRFARQADATSAGALLDRLRQVRQLLTDDWPYQAALLNGTAWLLVVPLHNEPEIAQVQTELEERYSCLLETCQQAKQRIATFLANILGVVETVLVHDYSSTVMDALQYCAGCGQKLSVYATVCHAARSDGERVVHEAASFGHEARIVDDLAAGTLLATGEVDMLLIGADAVLASGELINTTGTLPLAITAHYFRVPVYCPTELMKLSIPSVYGQALASRRTVESITEVYSPLFDVTPGEFVHAYVTESGLIPPASFSAAARQHVLVAELL
ncbi:MAG TPA: hypothetical protein VKV20_13450 [Ktedonobacteraceae bacterium]|nr:hypothetical protein [Ktedonobacteraceae bacterium]